MISFHPVGDGGIELAVERVRRHGSVPAQFRVEARHRLQRGPMGAGAGGGFVVARKAGAARRRQRRFR